MTGTPLNEFEQLNFDEGYSGEKTPTPYHEHYSSMSNHDSVRVPLWMTGLRPDIREEYAFKLVRSLPTAHIASLVNRLVPILHLDFVQFLPPELVLHILSFLPPKSLLNAGLTSRAWRRYALEPGLWRALFLQEGWEANFDEVKRFEKEMQRRIQIKQSEVPPSHPFMFSQASDRMIQREHNGHGGALGYANNTMSDDEELYPTPHGSSLPIISDLSLTMAPTLLAPGYHTADAPRLNWMFLFKHRKRLERNWRLNKYSQFHIPHPHYTHEAHLECVYTISYSSKWLVSGSRDKTIRIWNLKTRRLRCDPLVGHQASVLCLQFDESPEEDVIISGSSDASVIVWRFSTGKRLKTIKKAHDESVLNLRFNKKWLITCSKDKIIKVWNRRQLETLDKDYPWQSRTLWGPNFEPRHHPHHPEYNPAFIVPDPVASSGLNLINPFAKHKIDARTLPEYTAVNELHGHSAAVNAIQLYNDQIVSVSGDRSIKLWNLHSGLCSKTYIGHGKGIACIQYDGRTIVSGSSDKTIRIFDAKTQAEAATLQGHTALVRTVQASKNKIVSGSYDETVRIWVRDEKEGTWTHHAKLTQETPPRVPRTNAELVNAMNAIQQSTMHQFQQQQQQSQQQSQPQVGVTQNQATVTHHQSHPAGSAALMGAMVASQLLANPPPPPPQSIFGVATGSSATANPFFTSASPQPPSNNNPSMLGSINSVFNHNSSPFQTAPPPPSPTPAPPPPPQQVAAAGIGSAAATTPTSGAYRVFKLQFDSRWIICCTQHTRIVGWDYAAGDEEIVEASRFFSGA
ncbi:WD40 repeat-like protein [Ascodesmis nigricans]|uniref:WD40 repeat-like protein n=1 Tax=Ascodesmis nigricans TaxID=341454 RepID=A0A4S2N7S3_9PEZI|nr:WD40 repeat-like protein [Ascodesmis nigricans]